MSENPIVRDLVRKLKLFRETIKPLIRGGPIKSSLIPPNIREDAAKIYEEHGGMDILLSVLHVSADQIREWYRNIKADPKYYTRKVNKFEENKELRLPTKRKKLPSKPRERFYGKFY
ncbi:hypothetical protein SteCoe_12312 [Stentor coeruleus]|uniref:Uncharacterized protein n=1 Tax=Stentor coeruleus TaxID=5963 RepID=A0A1R2CB68_9CILI|nr:hypothetical protein SteCoe_12312 [Stentor coeruleus]